MKALKKNKAIAESLSKYILHVFSLWWSLERFSEDGEKVL